tara:strand:+ start:93 stop:809 length:717 start_codon:yes stop_codon:yes gene_type:complete
MKLIILLIVSSWTLMANAPNDRFDSKVKYEYNVYLKLLNLKLGQASLSIKDPDNIEGINVYHLNFNVRTTKLGDSVYKIRNKIDVWINQETLNVVKQNKSIRELRKKKNSETIIRNKQGITNGKEFIVKENSFDPYSLILILSEFDIADNQSKKFNIVDAGKSRVIEIKNLGTEMIETPYGNKQGYTLSPIKNGQPVLKNKGDMEIIYVSINDILVPAKILLKLGGGVLELRLKKIRE